MREKGNSRENGKGKEKGKGKRKGNLRDAVWREIDSFVDEYLLNAS